jgi:hypothetical protein
MISSHNRKKSGSGSAFSEILRPILHSAEGLGIRTRKKNPDPQLYVIHILTSYKSSAVLCENFL